MRRAVIAAFALAASVIAAPATVQAGEQVDTEPLRDAVTVNGITKHLQKLQDIATANGGNRRAGTAGFDASVKYVKKKLKKAGYKVKVQPFDFVAFDELQAPTLARVGADGATLEVTTLLYSGSGSVEGSIGPAGDAGGVGCSPSALPAVAAGETRIALVQDGGCDLDVKVGTAVAAGYAAVIVVAGGEAAPNAMSDASLTAPASIPVVGVSGSVGQELRGAAAEARFEVVTKTATPLLSASNVIATSRSGNPKKRLVVGAHLDSVTSPGINDNGSGSATILEIAEQMNKLGIDTKRQVRFAFWGAEEYGLLGSKYHVAHLSQEQRDKIVANLNFDMVGSTNYVRFVYDGDGSGGGPVGPPGSAEIEAIFVDYFESQDLFSDPTPFNGRSDYGPFIAVGIPAGGLFSGAEGIKTPEQEEKYGGTAGVAYDTCYHKVCDTISNVNDSALDEMSDAAAHTTLTMAKPRKG